MSTGLEHSSDSSLLTSCSTGDARSAERAFRELYRRHKPFVLRVALGILHDNNLALDALQETFTWLLRQFPPTGDGLTLTAKMTTLLYPVARNSAISEWRKANRLNADADVEPDSLPVGESSDDSDDDDRDLQRVLRELSFERREVVTLKYVHDMPLADIALALDVPVGTVKSRLHAAVQQLRNSPNIKQFFEK